MGRNERDFCPFLFPSAIYGAYPSSSPSSTTSPPSSPPSSSSYSHSSSSLSITSPFLSPSTADGYLNRQCSEQEITMEFNPAPRSNSTVSKRRPAMTKIAIPLEFGESNSSINSNNYSNCLNPDKSWKLQDLLFQAYSSLHNQQFMIFCVLLWLIWHNRNCILFNEDQLLDWAIGYVEEFQTAALKRKGTGQGVRQEEEDNRWVPPRNGLFKVNVDAGFQFQNNCYSTAVVIRDHEGTVHASGFRRYEGIADVSVGEAYAIRDGISLAKEVNLTPFAIFSDSKVVVDSFNSETLPCNDIGLIGEDCHSMVSRQICEGFYFANRKSNRVADALAHMALGETDQFAIWLGHVPQAIYPFVMADISAFD